MITYDYSFSDRRRHLKRFLLLLFTLIATSQFYALKAQVTIGTGTTPHPSAVLELTTPTNDKGFLPPRLLNTELEAISNPADGLIVYCTDCADCGDGTVGALKVYSTSNGWSCIGSAGEGSAFFTIDCSTIEAVGSLSVGGTNNSRLRVTVNVTRLGTFSVRSDLVNNVYYEAWGAFSTLGVQTLELPSFGTAQVAGSFTWTLQSPYNCSITQTVSPDKTGRIVKVLNITNTSYGWGSGTGAFTNNLFNANPNEFGPAGLTKLFSVENTNITVNTFTSVADAEALEALLGGYDIVFMPAVSGLGAVANFPLMNELIAYMKKKRTVFMLEGDDVNAAAVASNTGFDVQLLNGIGVPYVGLTSTATNTEVIWPDTITASPIIGKYGSVADKGINRVNGNVWPVTTTRTDLSFAYVRAATPETSLGAFWDPEHYLYFNGDDDGSMAQVYAVCNIASPNSTTNCVSNGVAMRGARWLANLMAFVVENVPEKDNVSNRRD